MHRYATLWLMVVAGCTGTQPTRGGGHVVIPFEGSFDVTTQKLVLRSPAADELHPSATLSYGFGGNQVYFHTVPGTVEWNAPVLSGNVTAVNNYSFAIPSLTAYIDWISAADASSNLPLDYGTVNAQSESAAQAWQITNPSLGNITFRGHAEGTLPTILFSEDFSGYATGGNGVQCQSMNPVHHSGNLAGWTKGGTNAIHAVTVNGNVAVTFFDTNVITMSTGVAANTNGMMYTVSFKAGPSVWGDCNQATLAGANLTIEVLRANGTVLATHNAQPGAWPGTQTLTAGSFTYTGDGSGLVRLRVRDPLANGRFAGAIDDLVISQ